MSAQRERGGLEQGGRADVGEVGGAVTALPTGRWVLAVSGGRDSMVLLHALAALRRNEIAAVATFDHGSGLHARRAAALVTRTAERLGLSVVSGSAAKGLPRTEAAWRQARHAFLDAWAEELDAAVVTAHTRDDEIETVVQRLLRDSGPRGLAGMRSASRPVGGPRRVRPLLAVPRACVAAYATEHRVRWLQDPTNADPAFQRNRVRHELLPALERARPGFSEWCWSIGGAAATWRDRMDDLLTDLGVQRVAPGSVVVPLAPLTACAATEWAVLWPAIAARAGVVMDRRGIARASEWAPRARNGQEIPLSGDARIVRTASTFVVHAMGTTEPLPDYILEQ